MLSHQLGFVSSWKMLTRDKGWIKPILVLALVSLVPILGQIVLLGYGLEWARLTAWGVDSAPKQRNIGYGKMLSTGGVAFLIGFLVSVVLGGIGLLVASTLYRAVSVTVGMGSLVTGGLLSAVIEAFFEGGISPVPFVILFVVNLIIESLVLAAQMRATIYDGFGAGWRFDRIVQMAVRDIWGFIHVSLVAALSTLVATIFERIVTSTARLFYFMGSFMGVSGLFGYSNQIFMGGSLNPLGALAALILVIVVLFLFQVVEVVLELISINVMGQWFQRFDIGRWGVSSAPLPDDVPRKEPDGNLGAAGDGAWDGGNGGATEGSSEQARPSESEYASEPASADKAGEAPHDGDEGEQSREPILLGPISED